MTSADPLPVELLVSDDARRSLDSKSQRCIDRIRRNVGEGGLRAFLCQPQPAFGDMTGAEVARAHPEALLRRLDYLEQNSGDRNDAEPEFDPRILDHPPQRRSGKKIDSVLAILDELERRAK